MSRTIIKCVLAAVVSGLVSLPDVQAAGISGTYECSGTNPDGTLYRGRVQIQPHGEAYLISWQIGNQQHSGIGILYADVFATTWSYRNNPRYGGVTSYKLVGNGQLKGRWVGTQGGNVMHETLTPLFKTQPVAKAPIAKAPDPTAARRPAREDRVCQECGRDISNGQTHWVLRLSQESSTESGAGEAPPVRCWCEKCAKSLDFDRVEIHKKRMTPK